MLAFDRTLQLDGIPMPPDRAEALIKRIGTGRLNVRIVLDVTDAERFGYRLEGTSMDAGVLYVTLRRVDLLAPDGSVIHTMEAAAFPLSGGK